MRMPRLVEWGIGLALGALLLGQLLSQSPRPGPETAPAVRYVPEPCCLRGTVIRREITIRASEGPWYPLLSPGSRAARGQALFSRSPGNSEDAGTDPLPVSGLRRRQALRAAAAALREGTVEDREQAARTLAALLSGDADSDAADRTGAVIRAPAAGMFAPGSDGLEAALDRDPWGEYSLPPGTAPEAVGRLITGDMWYLRTDNPLHLVPGDRVEVQLPGREEALSMTAEAVRSGRVLLSCGSGLREVAEVREISVKILPNCEKGLEIPAKAVYTVGEASLVDRWDGQQRETVPVTVLLALPEGRALVRDGENLRPGDLVCTAREQER